MKIIEKEKNRQLFHELKPATVFANLEGQYFIKTERLKAVNVRDVVDNYTNAVNLETGVHCYFYDGDLVYSFCNSELYIK